jgi:hypothetical protein
MLPLCAAGSSGYGAKNITTRVAPAGVKLGGLASSGTEIRRLGVASVPGLLGGPSQAQVDSLKNNQLWITLQ